jgi:RHS repeat-associated protein
VPLVVERDGATYRMLGGLVIEERVNGKAGTQYYPHRDYASSVRVVTDGTGAVAASLGYDGDWGSARVQGQDYVASDSGMEAFYRFQSQEAEIFPLNTLNIEDQALESWLDELQLYHFPYREYSAGLAIFLSHDPAGQSISPYAAFGANPANITDPTGAVSRWIGMMPPVRDFLWTVSWGAVNAFMFWVIAPATNAGTYILVGGGRLAAHWIGNFIHTRSITIGDREVWVQGPIALRRVAPAQADLEDFLNITLLEFGEAITGVIFGPTELALGQSWGVFITFLAMGTLDFIWGAIRLIRQEAPLANVFASEIRPRNVELWIEGSVDALYYTGLLFVWNRIFVPGEGDVASTVFGAMWFLRNFSHRLARRYSWDWVRSQITRVVDHFIERGPRLGNFTDDVWHNIYIRRNERGDWYAFFWRWHAGQEEDVDLAALLAPPSRRRVRSTNVQDAAELAPLRPALTAPQGNNSEQRIGVGGHEEERWSFRDHFFDQSVDY